MSYFGSEKRLLLSISALSSTATQAIGLTETDVTVFNGQSLTQLVSSIGYPSISSASQQITLEAGWYYLLSVRIKVDDATQTTTEYLRFFVSDTSNNPLSSTGLQIIYRDTNATVGQENCIVYIDATSAQQTIKIRAQKVNSTGTVTINGNTDAGASNFKSHLLIKAWK